MGRIVLIIIVIIAIILAYLIAANIGGWWPYKNATSSPSPTVSVTPNPSRTPAPTSTPMLGASRTPTPTSTPAPTPSANPNYPQKITDGLPTYEVYVPSDWTIRAQEGYRGKQISYQEVASPDYTYHTNQPYNTQIYYDTGSLLIIDVVSGSYPAPSLPDPRVAGGTLLQYHLIQNGRTYLLTFAYNSSTLANGQQIFDQIVNSA